MNLEELIKECVRQNPKAQEKLYNTYKNTLFALCLKYCNNESEAQDNLHDSFLEIFTNINNFKGNGSFEGWIKRITINKAISRYKQKLHLVYFNNEKTEYNDTDIYEEEIDFPIDFLLSLIQGLPHQYRLVFNLYELDNYSHKDIADMLSISENTSKSNLHRAKLILKEKIIEQKSYKTNLLTHGK